MQTIPSPTNPAQFEFAGFLLDPGTRTLTRSGEPVPLTPKEFQALLLLAQAGGQAVARETLIQAIWPDTIVGDTSLGRIVSVLRRHLGTDAIVSISRFGYRLAPPVTLLDPTLPAPVPVRSRRRWPFALAAPCWLRLRRPSPFAASRAGHHPPRPPPPPRAGIRSACSPCAKAPISAPTRPSRRPSSSTPAIRSRMRTWPTPGCSSTWTSPPGRSSCWPPTTPSSTSFRNRRNYI